MALVWAVILATSLVIIAGFARAGSLVFWKSAALPAAPVAAVPARPALPLAAAGAMVAGMIALAVFAGPITGYLDATAAGLFDPTDYLQAVLGPQGIAMR